MHTPGSIEPEGPFDGIQWSSVGLGCLVDIVLTYAGNLPLLAIFAPEALTAPPAEVERVLREAARAPDLLIAALLLGTCATAIGAYVGARRAGVQHLRHGGWVAIGSLLLGLLPLLLFDPAPPPPLWYEVLGIALALPAGLTGGWIARRRDRF